MSGALYKTEQQSHDISYDHTPDDCGGCHFKENGCTGVKKLYALYPNEMPY
mgnify:CR=1 FL=1